MTALTGLKQLPGVLLLLAVGLAGKWLEARKLIPGAEYVLWAILLGLLLSNTVRVPRLFLPGVDTYELWLKLGIVLMGARFALGDLFKLGGVSLALVGLELLVAIAIVGALGRAFHLKPKLVSLLACGSAVCGVSAIIACKGAIDAEDDDAAFAIAAIVALGAFGLFAYPAIGHALGMGDHAFGLWAGLAVDNTAEAAATGALFSDEASRIAVLTKSTRNATIGFVVLGFALYWAAKGQAQQVGNKVAFVASRFPRFVLGFLGFSLLASVGAFSKEQSSALANLSRWAFLLTFAGVGLKLDFRALRKQGLRPFVVGALAELSVSVVTLGLVLLAERLVGLAPRAG